MSTRIERDAHLVSHHVRALKIFDAIGPTSNRRESWSGEIWHLSPRQPALVFLFHEKLSVRFQLILKRVEFGVGIFEPVDQVADVSHVAELIEPFQEFASSHWVYRNIR